MPPHRALIIPDVLHEVFKHFATHPWLTAPGIELVTSEVSPSKSLDDSQLEAEVKDKRRTLAHAARACKAFAEPASRVLWEVQNGFAPIISVLKNTQTPGGDKSAPDWARFEHLGRRVRVLFAGKGLSNDDTLSMISSRYDGGPVFPNLRVLSYGYPPLDTALLRGLCASPALCFIATWEDDSTLGKSLSVISNACPEVVHLHVYSFARLDEDCHRALAKFNNLHTAHFDRIENALFCHLGVLPNLRKLHGTFTVSNPDMGTEAAFPALQELDIQDEDDNSDFLLVLPFISSRALASLSLHVELVFTKDMLEYPEEMCALPALARLCHFDLSLNFGFNQWDYPDEPFEGFTLAGVLPFLQRLRELKIVAIFVGFATSTVAGFGVEDEDLDVIGSTWPDLVSLTLAHSIDSHDWPGGPEGIGRPSLGAVVSLAGRCRKMEVLDVEFDSVDAGALEALEARAAACSAPQTELRRIVEGPRRTDLCQKLRLADPARVAAALRKLFPNVESRLEMVGGGGAERDSEAVKYRNWSAAEMRTDMFHLMKALEDSRLDGQV